MTDFDFIPPQYHELVNRRRVSHAQALWGIALAVTMGLWLWSHQLRVAVAHSDLESAREQWAALELQRETIQQLATKHRRLAQLAGVLRGLNDSASLTVTLAELGALLPDGTVLTRLAYESRSAPPPQSVQPPVTAPPARPSGSAGVGVAAAPPADTGLITRLRLTGAAQSNNFYSAFAARLGGSPLFRDVHTSNIKDAVIAGRNVLRFEIECDVLPQEGDPK